MTAEPNDVAEKLLREYHRRLTHVANLQWKPDLRYAQVEGELLGLRGALGIALGGDVQGGQADSIACDRYMAWVGSEEAEAAACACRLCTRGAAA